MHITNCFYVRRCPVCGELIPLNNEYCSCSAQPARHVPQELFHLTDDPYDAQLCFSAPYYYDGIIRQQLLSFKFQNRPSLAKPLGLTMAAHAATIFSDVSFDCVTFVPMAADDLRNRSFNQSALLAQWVARTIFIQCSALLEKVKLTPTQHTLTVDERLRNLEGAFQPTALAKPGMTVLLCDDIKTTGTTLRRCRDTLLAAGVKEVYCLSCAMSDYSSLDF